MALIDWVILFSYLTITLVIGVWLSRRNRDGDDYFFNVENARPGQNLNLGDFVKFDYYQTQKGPSAKNILKIKS